MTKHIIGILGGMGPAATADMFQKFIALTPATCDQQHIPLLIASIPDIPDRTAYLLQNGLNPEPIMAKYIKTLERAGATCIIIACNTAHYWFKQLQRNTSVKMISMIDSTIEAVKNTGKSRIAVLATDATLATGLYAKRLQQEGLSYIALPNEAQKAVMQSIYLFKSGQTATATNMMKKQAEILLENGVELIILGCTEIPIILADNIKTAPALYIDSTLSLVKSAIHWYNAHTEKPTPTKLNMH